MAQNDETTTGDVPGALEGVSRIRLDCEQTDLSIVADPAMVGQVFLSADGGSNGISLIREADEIVVYQKGRRSGGRPPTLTVPASGCPPISGSVERGELYLSGLNGSVDLKHGQGDTRVDGGTGSLEYSVGKGDVRLSNRSGSVAINAGAGDIHASTMIGELVVSVGKGDVHCETVGGSLTVKLGSGDFAVSDSAGSLTIKSGSGDVAVTRPRHQTVVAKIGSGDVIIHNGSLVGMAVEVGRGDIISSAELLLPGHAEWSPGGGDQSLVSRILRSKGVAFSATDKGLRISRPGFEMEAGDAGLRIMKGGMSFVAGDSGVHFSNDEAASVTSFSAETGSGDISFDLPGGVPVRVEALIAGGEIHSDIPLVSVARPGPRGATQRYVGVSDPSATERIDLRLKAGRGDIRVRLPRNARRSVSPPRVPEPPVPPTPPVSPDLPDLPTVASPGQPEATTTRVRVLTDEQQMRAILDALSRGEVSVSEADQMLKALGTDRGDRAER